MLVIFILDAVLLALFRIYLDYVNKKRDREQGVVMDPEPRGIENAISPDETSSERTEEVDMTDWENRGLRYHV